MINELTPTRVEEVFMDSLFKDGEDTSNAIIVEGIMRRVGFHPGRLEGHLEDVRELLSQLPDEFHAEVPGAGGWSFLNACNNRDGELWTGSHETMEQLFMLGVALELVQCLLPRDMWSVLPGSMPYYLVSGCRPKDASNG